MRLCQEAWSCCVLAYAFHCGGNCNNESNGGPFCVNMSNSTNANSDYGFRLCEKYDKAIPSESENQQWKGETSSPIVESLLKLTQNEKNRSSPRKNSLA